MAGWDGDEVYTAPEYKTDIEQKTFTLCRADDWPQFNYSMSRFDKMTADRYAGWKLVVPANSRRWQRSTLSKRPTISIDDTDAWMPREVVGPQLLTPKAR